MFFFFSNSSKWNWFEKNFPKRDNPFLAYFFANNFFPERNKERNRKVKKKKEKLRERREKEIERKRREV